MDWTSELAGAAAAAPPASGAAAAGAEKSPKGSPGSGDGGFPEKSCVQVPLRQTPHAPQALLKPTASSDANRSGYGTPQPAKESP